MAEGWLPLPEGETSDEASAAGPQDLPCVQIQVAGAGGILAFEAWLPLASRVSALKEELCRRLGVPVLEQRLALGTELLQDGRTLQESLPEASLDAAPDAVLSVTLVRMPKPTAISGAVNGPLKVFDLSRANAVNSIGGDMNLRCMAVDWETQLLMTSGLDGRLRLWDLESGELQKEFRVSCSSVLCGAVDWGLQVALLGGQAGELLVVDLEDGEAMRRQRCHAGPMLCMAADFDTTQVLTGGLDGTLALWDYSEGTCLGRLQGHGEWVTCVVADWQARRAVSGGADRCLRLWDLETMQLLQVVRGARFDSSTVLSLAVDWSRQQVLTGNQDGALILWDLATSERLRSIHAHNEYVTCLSVDWKAQRALSGGHDHCLRLWDLDLGQCLREFGSGCRVKCLAANWGA